MKRVVLGVGLWSACAFAADAQETTGGAKPPKRGGQERTQEKGEGAKPPRPDRPGAGAGTMVPPDPNAKRGDGSIREAHTRLLLELIDQKMTLETFLTYLGSRNVAPERKLLEASLGKLQAWHDAGDLHREHVNQFTKIFRRHAVEKRLSILAMAKAREELKAVTDPEARQGELLTMLDGLLRSTRREQVSGRMAPGQRKAVEALRAAWPDEQAPAAEALIGLTQKAWLGPEAPADGGEAVKALAEAMAQKAAAGTLGRAGYVLLTEELAAWINKPQRKKANAKASELEFRAVARVAGFDVPASETLAQVAVAAVRAGGRKGKGKKDAADDDGGR